MLKVNWGQARLVDLLGWVDHSCRKVFECSLNNLVMNAVRDTVLGLWPVKSAGLTTVQNFSFDNERKLVKPTEYQGSEKEVVPNQ